MRAHRGPGVGPVRADQEAPLRRPRDGLVAERSFRGVAQVGGGAGDAHRARRGGGGGGARSVPGAPGGTRAADRRHRRNRGAETRGATGPGASRRGAGGGDERRRRASGRGRRHRRARACAERPSEGGRYPLVSHAHMVFRAGAHFISVSECSHGVSSEIVATRTSRPRRPVPTAARALRAGP